MKQFLKRILWTFWLCLPLVIWFWYQQYGEAALKYDQAGTLSARAQSASAKGDYKKAAELFGQARELVPDSDIERKHRLMFAQAQAEIRTSTILDGSEKLSDLLEQVTDGDPGNLKKAIRSELATSKYHTALIMRKEGAPADEWRPVIEEARQQYRRLAEDDAPKNEDSLQNLEASIKLERMDQSLLQGLPLPKNCPSDCDSLSQRKRKQRKNKGKKKKDSGKKKKKKKKQDARRQITKQKTKDAGLNEAEGGGS
jgi:tetratricopeptide (TPR) repeat protein